MKKLLMLLCAMSLALPGLVQAELSSLSVQFPTGTGPFGKGRVVNVAATTNGTGAEYRFAVHRMDGGTAVPVVSTAWSSANTFAMATSPVNVLPGQHRLLVYVREAAKKSEVLSKYKFFTVVAASEASACDWLNGRTLTRTVTGGSYSAGTRTGAEIAAGISLALPAAGVALKSISFDPAGNASAVLETVTAQTCSFVCSTTTIATAGKTLAGTYTCSGGNVNVSLSGLVPTPLSVSGAMTVNAVTGDLTTGARTYR